MESTFFWGLFDCCIDRGFRLEVMFNESLRGRFQLKCHHFTKMLLQFNYNPGRTNKHPRLKRAWMADAGRSDRIGGGFLQCLTGTWYDSDWNDLPFFMWKFHYGLLRGQFTHIKYSAQV